jgi:protein tyrosine phosphatase (PTP) superfamily phosphohydrolase (DUF442 family)
MVRFTAFVRAVAALAAWAAFAICGQRHIDGAQDSAGQPALLVDDSRPTKIRDDWALPNVWRIHPRVLSGGQPGGAAGFRALRELGVKTILSVDAARPDVEGAKAFDLRYVHLPHGYDGIPNRRALELAKAIHALEGPIYVHCHHGKHRSPAAAAVGCVAAGLMEPDVARKLLDQAGTSPQYRGLFAAVARARRVEPAVLDALEVEFPETAETPAMAAAMVEIEHRHDHLRQLAANGWRSVPEHPDLAPAHEALLLRELFSELLRNEATLARPASFLALAQHADEQTRALEEALRARSGPHTLEQRAAADAAWQRVHQACAACHEQHRDVPLD